MKKSKNWPENHRFFGENHWFLKGFEITRTSSSLVLNFFKDSEPTVLWFWNGSGIFKEPEAAVH
jgi:hypothetical protein